MTERDNTDRFEEQIRLALAVEATDPAPPSLVARVAEMRRTVQPGSSRLGRVRARLAPPSEPGRRGGLGLGFGLGLAAIAVLVIGLGMLVRGLGPSQETGEPGASAPIASAAPTASPVPTAPASASEPPPGPAGGLVPAGFVPVSVTFVSGSQGWVLGSATCAGAPCAAIVRTTDGGRSWSGIPAPSTSIAPSGQAPSGVNGLRFADALNGWAFGPELWATHDGGATWREVTLPGATAETQVTALESSGGAVHAAFLPGLKVATSPIAGDAWVVSSTGVEVGAGPVPHTQLVLHGTAGWLLQVDRVVVGGARLGAGSWGAWQPPCLDAVGPAMLAAGSDRDLVAACDVGLWGTPTGVHLYTSSDSGSTFAEIPGRLPVFDLQGIAVPPASTTVVVGGSLSGVGSALVESLDGGKTWGSVYVTQGGTFSELGFTTSDQGVAIATATEGAVELVMTRDGGRTWAPVPIVGP
jgi:photosystem II stability/assembly factor-like uncharacterized protein